MLPLCAWYLLLALLLAALLLSLGVYIHVASATVISHPAG